MCTPFLSNWSIPIYDKTGSFNSWMAGQEGGVGPVDHFRARSDRHKQPVLGSAVRNNSVHMGLSDLFFDSPGDCPDCAGKRQDTAGRFQTAVQIKQTGQGIRFHILRAGSVREGKVKSVKK